MLRRHLDAVLLAHTMDPSRRELYVEGQRDRLFLKWLVGADLNPNTSIREIDWVELPTGIAGGRRGHLLYFARVIGPTDFVIRILIDADFDRLLSRPVPLKTWITDPRDLEGYVLRTECLDKILRLGICTEKMSGVELLKCIHEQGRKLGLLRLYSEINSLNLPFQKTDLSRYFTVRECEVELNWDGYLRALLQNAKISLKQLPIIKNGVEELGDRHCSTPNKELVHGKDAIVILESVLKPFGVASEDAARILWASFEPRFVERESALQEVLIFLNMATMKTPPNASQPA
jgi:hypothetical protein